MKFGLILLVLFASVCYGLDAGDKAAGFALKSVDGKEIKLADYAGKNVVVMFIATKCPYSNAFNKVMANLAAQYSSRGVVFLGINSNKSEPMAEVVEHAKKNFGFPVLKDEGNKVADAYKASVTPEAFLIKGDGTIVYHGALGSSNNPTTDASQANFNEIKAALDELLSGKPVSKAKTKAFGCTIKRV